MYKKQGEKEKDIQIDEPQRKGENISVLNMVTQLISFSQNQQNTEGIRFTSRIIEQENPKGSYIQLVDTSWKNQIQQQQNFFPSIERNENKANVSRRKY